MKKVLTQLALVAGILILANLIGNRLFLRLDFTADKRYTLSEATKEVVKGVNDVMTVKAYFSSDLPPQFLSIRKDFEDLLVEYETLSGRNLVYEFINPNESEETEGKAQREGIAPLMVTVTERDQAKQLRAYMGAVVEYGSKKEVIPFVQPAGMEFALTMAVKKLSKAEKPKIAFLSGHGESTQYNCVQAAQQLEAQYDIETYNIADSVDIPASYKALLIVSPADTVPDAHLLKLDHYLQGGGSIFLAYSPVSSDLSSGQGFLPANPDIGIKKWLKDKGIVVNDDYIIDAHCGQVSVQQRQGPFTFNSAIEFPFFPLISNFGGHPATKGLEQVMMPFLSSIEIVASDSSRAKIAPILLSSDMSAKMPAPAVIDINKEWTRQDFPQSKLIGGVAAEGKLVGQGLSRLVFVANGQFAVNGQGENMQQLNEDNVNLLVNSLDWLADDTGLIALRTKGITSRPLEQIEDSTKELVKYGNILFPLLLIAGYGIFRRWRTAYKRQQWLQGKY